MVQFGSNAAQRTVSTGQEPVSCSNLQFICSRIQHFLLFEAHPSLDFLDTIFPLSSLYFSESLCSVSLSVEALCRTDKHIKPLPHKNCLESLNIAQVRIRETGELAWLYTKVSLFHPSSLHPV